MVGQEVNDVKNFFKADFYRVMTKKSRIFLMILMAAGELGYLAYQASKAGNNAIQVTMKIGNMELIYLYFIALSNLFIIYRDDFRAQNMQVAIGIGVERWKIVVAKWLTTTMVILIDITFLTAVEFAVVISEGKLAGGFAVNLVIMGQMETVIQIVLASTLAMIIIFQMQKAIWGVLAYLYVSAGITSQILSAAAGNRIVQKLQLWNIGAGDQGTAFIGGLMIGEFNIGSFLMVVLYLVIGIGGSIYLFSRKEIELN